MNVETRLRDRLIAHAPLMVVAAGGVFTGTAANTAEPQAGYVCIVRGSLESPARPNVGPGEQTDVTIDCIGRDYTHAAEIARLVGLQLEGYSGVGVQGAFRTNWQYNPAAIDDELGIVPHFVRLTFEVFLDEAEG